MRGKDLTLEVCANSGYAVNERLLTEKVHKRRGQGTRKGAERDEEILTFLPKKITLCF